ncbi:lipolytic protein [Aliarcobacter cryaerophilus ATCC 43158]|uniref:Sialate O-acetylesterase-like protein n=1 Tax=Aliarcobacter cryaerophilus ATCC 43158 TaxID=1032070 RepID=A0AAD0TUP2_9BACT|nr:GDSL-type esterase/lipase family protein [Aliarcobacter cryaerophilus]AYJ80849.1 sialate O-acetylesterase-like protein [Aliarcobacter cryaerophilus ATCC 43158]PRM98344.1 lipolytic protein [Aliarcobacter cryaerophilus]QCZ23175.1 lipolytic protein [Aliarcobacter cryaerophilus ATCC 43158]
MKNKLLITFFIGMFFVVCSANEVVKSEEWKIQNDPYYKHKVSQFEMLKDINNIETMMLGDSITDEGEWSELWGMVVQNRGISGDTTFGVLDRLYTINPNIKRVFIMIGVNDIMRGSSEDLVFENYKMIIKFFQEKNIDVVIQATLYIGESRKQNFNQKIEKLNQKLEEFAKINKIVFINLNPIFAPQKTLLKNFTKDDLHLNADAYKLWIETLKKLKY